MKPRADIQRVVYVMTGASIVPARDLTAWNDAPEPMPDWDLLGQPEPDVEYDQRVAW